MFKLWEVRLSSKGVYYYGEVVFDGDNVGFICYIFVNWCFFDSMFLWLFVSIVLGVGECVLDLGRCCVDDGGIFGCRIGGRRYSV